MEMVPTNLTPGRRPRRASRVRAAALAGVVVGAFALAACGGGTSVGGSKDIADSDSQYGFKAETQGDSQITVWVDSTRQPAAEAYNKAHPDNPVKIVTYDGNANGSNSFKTKFQLFDRAGSGWPDVVFTTDNNSASWGSFDGTGDLAAMNKGLVPDDTLSGFADGALDVCTIDGVSYCLRNDLAQNVLWYNKKLMDQFGYTVPTTWEDYEALADKVATEHPGYIVGTAGDAWTPEIYMWAAECPANDVTGATSVTVDTSDPNCVKAAQMLDKLIANKTMSTLSLFGPEFAKTEGDKVLMLPGPSWYGGSVFQGTLKTPAGEIAAAAPLKWSDASDTSTGNVGGGAWWISSHSKNLAAASDFATWVTSQSSFDGTLAPTYPAFSSAASDWVAETQKSGYYANDISEPFQQAAGEVWSGWGSAAFSQEAIWAKVVQAGMTQGKTIESLLPAWQTEIENQAKTLGYEVSK
ncbi:ABC transporter substrate-binding protein [Nocardioides mangrovi]|uniref:Extracellular solute-binding protein n=1 Tax=Nocardioides mangrovi TaxID=2874580 RepID=A0ABS7UJZ5_9ACTN|nr:extracellular solute-binding protein [Nocardioides mangrovi]MBZ5740968.1 extracellular solute-binding protein [Nocardioides mangrovi]